MSTVLILLLVLAVLVLVHEFGHFIVAKCSGIDVEEFGLGLPPRAWGMRIGDTLYSLNWIPFGGFVRIAGDDEDSTPGSSVVRTGRDFKSKSFFTKTSVMAGGVIANTYLAFLLIALAFWIGIPVSLESYPNVSMRDTWVSIVGTAAASPATNAKLPTPSRLSAIGVDGKKFAVVKPEDVQSLIQSNVSGEVILYILDNNMVEKTYSLKSELRKDTGLPGIGVMLDKVGIPAYGPLGAIQESFTFSGKLILNTATELVLLIKRTFSGSGSLESISGPVGIAGILANATSEGLGPLLFIVALISMSLAVINFVPFPALDGGRFLFLVIEFVLRRPIKPALSRAVNLTGFALLLLLMVFVTYNDIVSL